jgi:hypothetical protein
MSVQTVEVCVHVEMQLQLIYDLNTANTRFTIVESKIYYIKVNFAKLGSKPGNFLSGKGNGGDIKI